MEKLYKRHGNKLKFSLGLIPLSLVGAIHAENYLISLGNQSALKLPPFLLAKNYQEKLELSLFLVSEKLDGVRAYWNGSHLVSRGGHIINAPIWFTRNFPNVELDGELWLGRKQFEKLSGIVRKHRPIDREWHHVKYMLFDLPKDLSSFELRYKKLQLIKKKTTNPHINVVKQNHIASKAKLDEQLALIIAKGGEGLMLHRKDSLYQAKRSFDLQKMKPFDDEEATVIAHIEGKGKYKNMMGAIEVINKDGIRFKIGSGFSDKERLSPPPINSQITYRFRGKTNKNTPRFATYLRMREFE